MTAVKVGHDFCHVLFLHFSGRFTLAIVMKKSNCAVIILAGGKSERMGFPKPFLNLRHSFFLEKIVDEYIQSGIEKILVVLNEELLHKKYEKYIQRISSNALIIKNGNPEKGRFYSIKSGLENLLSYEFCYIQNIDNPFVKSDIIQKLWVNRNESGFTSPVYKDRGGHPVLLSGKIVNHIIGVNHQDARLDEVLRMFPNTKIEVNDESILMNINTYEEYEQLIVENLVL